jgi:hypothetical protein
MQTATRSTSPAPINDPARTAPAGWCWAVMLRKRKGESWQVLSRVSTAEAAWGLICSHGETGEFHAKLVRVGSLDARERGGR